MRNSLGSKVFLVIAVVLALVVQFAFVGGATAASAVKELKWAVFVPENDYMAPPLKQFRDDVEKFTNGAVKIRIYWPGQLAEVKEMVDVVKTGSVEMSTSAPTFYPSMFPLNVALQSFPMLLTSPEQATYVWRGLFRDIPEVQKEFAGQNQVCLNRATLAPYLTLSKKPYRTAADFKGPESAVDTRKVLFNNHAAGRGCTDCQPHRRSVRGSDERNSGFGDAERAGLRCSKVL